MKRPGNKLFVWMLTLTMILLTAAFPLTALAADGQCGLTSPAETSRCPALNYITYQCPTSHSYNCWDPDCSGCVIGGKDACGYACISSRLNSFLANLGAGCVRVETPAPVVPAPADPAPVDPAPVVPAPIDPAPVIPAPIDATPVTDMAAQVVALVNVERAAGGLAPLTLDADLSAAALVRAEECKISFSHTRPDGRSCFTVLSERNISYGRAGENLAIGQATPKQVVREWMASPGHRANIMNSAFTRIGVAATPAGGNYVGFAWAQCFTD